MNIQKEILAAILLLIVSFARAQTVEYIHTDALGSPVAVTNASGAVIERTVYEPYGAVINRPVTNGPGYTGHVMDAATGLNYMQQRYYDPQVGRFLSNDPVTATSVGGNFNRYWYANNNPYSFNDPDGRESACVVDSGCKTFAGEPPVEAISLALDFVPGVGDVKGVVEAIMDPSLPNVAAAAVGLVPIVGDVGAKLIKGADKIADVAKAVDSPTVGKKVTSARRDEILERDQNPDGSWTCATCGHKTTNPDNIHTGHVTPRSKGGDLSDQNLRCEGAACNLSQGNRAAPKPGMTCAARGSCGAPYGRKD